MEQCILVTGGAGFIGTHTVVRLLNQGFKVSIIDNLDNSVVEAVHRVRELRELVGPDLSNKLEFNLGDIRSKGDIEKLFSKQIVDAVIHFAGLKAVGESVGNPHRYFDNNFVGTINLCKLQLRNIHFFGLNGHEALGPSNSLSLIETGESGWELALVTPQNNSNNIPRPRPHTKLAGGFDELLLDSL